MQKERIAETDPPSPISYYTILRYGNVYGPRQTAKGEGGVVAVLMERIIKGTQLTIHGDGEQTRDFVYVKDVVRANLAAKKRVEQEIIHVSTANRTSINDLARLLMEFHGTDLHYGK